MVRLRFGRIAWFLAAAIALQGARPAPAQEAITLRVMTYNIAYGRMDLSRVAETIRASAADIVGLQEVDVHWAERSGFRDQAGTLADALGMHLFFAPIYALPPAEAGRPERQFGLAVLSRYPIVSGRNHEITRLSTQSESPAPRPMPGFLEATLDVGGTRVRLFDTHLDYRADPGVRRMQVADMLEIMGDLSAPTILVGDLNAGPESEELRPLLRRLRDVWGGEPDPGYTYPAEGPTKRIDFILVSEQVEVRSVRVLEAGASDHRPVVAELVVPYGLKGGVAEPDTIRPVPIPPLTVTVLRTPLALEAAPYAVDVAGTAQVRRGRPGLALDEALRGVAGVQVDNRFNYALGERISVRGFGARSQFGVRGIKVLVDGIPATLPDGQTTLSHVDLSSLGRVEVIRGPASALYGNAAGGVIQLATEEPPQVPWRQEVGALGGEHGLLRIHGALAGRYGPSSYLLSIARLAYGGHRDFGAADNLHANARLGYGSGASELRFTGHFVDYDADNPGSLSAEQLAEDRRQAHGPNKTQQTGEAGRQGQLGATWRRALGGSALELSAYGLARAVDNPIPPTIIDLERSAGGLHALLRSSVQVAGRALLWTVGAEAALQRDDRRNFQNLAGERGELRLDQLETVRNIASFAQLAAPFGDRLRILGGLRYDVFRFVAEDRLVGGSNPDDSGRRRMDAVSPSLGVLYAFGEGLGVYGNVATSFETPTTTELANRPDGAGGFNPALEPQRTRSLELGARGRVGGVAAYHLAAYRARIEGALIPFEVAAMPGRQFFRNAGSAVHRGVEGSASLRLAGGLLTRLAYTYTGARFESYSADDATHDGNRVPGVAPHRLEAGLSYEAPTGWFVDLEARHLSEIPVDDANAARSPAYTVADARAGVATLRLGGVELAPFAGVTNLFDAEYNAAVTVNAFGGRYFEPGPGRAFYVGSQLGFGARRTERSRGR